MNEGVEFRISTRRSFRPTEEVAATLFTRRTKASLRLFKSVKVSLPPAFELAVRRAHVEIGLGKFNSSRPSWRARPRRRPCPPHHPENLDDLEERLMFGRRRNTSQRAGPSRSGRRTFRPPGELFARQERAALPDVDCSAVTRQQDAVERTLRREPPGGRRDRTKLACLGERNVSSGKTSCPLAADDVLSLMPVTDPVVPLNQDEFQAGRAPDVLPKNWRARIRDLVNRVALATAAELVAERTGVEQIETQFFA